MDGQAVAADAGKVVRETADRIEGREVRNLLETVEEEVGADGLNGAIAVDGPEDADTVGVFGVGGDDEKGGGRASNPLLPSRAHEGVAGALGFGYFDWADGDGACGSRSSSEGAGRALFVQLIEKCGCGHGGELLSVCGDSAGLRGHGRSRTTFASDHAPIPTDCARSPIANEPSPTRSFPEAVECADSGDGPGVSADGVVLADSRNGPCQVNTPLG